MSKDGISQLIDPVSQLALDQVARQIQARIEAHTVESLSLNLRYPMGAKTQLGLDFKQQIQAQLQANAQLSEGFKLTWKTQIDAAKVSDNIQPHPAVKNVIGVFANKGGVGKSSVSASLAMALAAQGASVGVLDADIYGPSIPLIFGTEGIYPKTHGKKNWLPIEAHDLSMISIGHLLKKQAPAVWRGPMISSALKQLFQQTQWPALDYLIVDLPPGTGDVQLSLIQSLPLTGAVVVTTPQPLSLLDVRKNLSMLKKLSVNILGLVVNMQKINCPHCQESLAQGLNLEEISHMLDLEQYKVPIVGQIPQHQEFAEMLNHGKVQTINQLEIWPELLALATRVGVRIASLPRDYRHGFGNIVVK